MRLFELLNFGVKELEQAGIAEASLDARILLEAATGLNRTGIFLEAKKTVDKRALEKFLRLLDRRKRREPVAYILAEKEFWSMPFTVSPDVLIPRPETEFLLDRVLALADNRNLSQGVNLDLCCGSGVIAVVLAKETGMPVVAADISRKALEITSSNVIRHGLTHLIYPVQADLLEPFGRSRFSLVVTNPPYVRREDVLNNLEPEVSEFEPHLALDGGEKGLDLIKKIYSRLVDVLIPGGQLFMEIGYDQGDDLRELFTMSSAAMCFEKFDIIKDYAGLDRVVHAKRRAG